MALVNDTCQVLHRGLINLHASLNYPKRVHSLGVGGRYKIQLFKIYVFHKDINYS